ncbi:MAG: single-stranded DNA-binding protein [Lachnospira sp.]
MLDKVIENNRVIITGEIVSEFTFSHEVFGEGFYICNVSVNRLSDMVDIIPLMISERLIDVSKDYRGMNLEVTGQFRSYNRHEGNKNKLVLSIFVRELKFIEDDEMPEEQSKSNSIFLDGYICKPPIYRKTPLGREIADILIAVNRPYGKSDYIPCIAWGRNARFAGGLAVGSHLQVNGRVQSREYTKKIDEEEVEKRVAYEVSVSKIDLVDDVEDV